MAARILDGTAVALSIRQEVKPAVEAFKSNLQAYIELLLFIMASMTYLKAMEAGADVVDCALSPFALGTSQPATEALVAALERHPHAFFTLGYAPYVRRAPDANSGPVDGIPVFPATTLAARVPITRIAPVNDRARALGFDMYSEDTRRRAIELAVAGDAPAMAGPGRIEVTA